MVLNAKESALIRIGFLVGLTVLLSGCNVYDDVRLSMAREKLRQECFANFTNSCVSKTIDYNVLLVEYSRSVWLSKQDEFRDALGNKGGDLWVSLVKERTDELIDMLESARPGFFSRWFLGDAQPFSGKGMSEFSERELLGLQKALEAEFIELGKKEGLTANPKLAHKSPPPVEKSLTIQTARAPVVIEPVAELPDEMLTFVINGMIAAEIAKEGGNEFTEGRQFISVDLNGDDQMDAVVLFTIEGQGGGNSSYQSLAGFYRSGTGWAYQGHSSVYGAVTDIKAAGPQRIAVTTLTRGPDDPFCCPSIETVVHYGWNGREFELKDS